MDKPEGYEGTVWIKTYAMSLLADPVGFTPEQAVKLARDAWAKHQENERAIENLLKGESA